MFDHALSQYMPGEIERWGSCRHGVIHYVAQNIVPGPNTLKKSDIKIVTRGGKVFYPFPDDPASFIFFYNPGARLSMPVSALYQHPLSADEIEDRDGFDWSGYAIIHSTVPAWISGVHTKILSSYPITPDDNSLAVYDSYGVNRLVLMHPSGTDRQTESLLTDGNAKGSVSTISPDGRYHLAVAAADWWDPKAQKNRSILTKYTGSWPEMSRTSEHITDPNDVDLVFNTSGRRKRIEIDSVTPPLGCYEEEPDLNFRATTYLDPATSDSDEYFRHETLTSALAAVVSNAGDVDFLNLIYTSREQRARSLSLGGSISVDIGDADVCKKNSNDTTSYTNVIGAKQSSAETSESVGSSLFSVEISGWGGESRFSQNIESRINWSSTRVRGIGTMSDESMSDESVSTLHAETFVFDGIQIDCGVEQAQSVPAWGSNVKNQPIHSSGFFDSFLFLWVYSSGGSHTDGSPVALLRVYLCEYSADMYALAVAVARGYIVPDDTGGTFHTVSENTYVGSVFSHGRYTPGQHVYDHVNPVLLGASNPKTGQVLRDTPYPVIFI